MTPGKTIALTRWTIVVKVTSLLFNVLSRLVITFLPRSKCLLISWLQSPSAGIWEPKKIKSVTVSTVSPSICHEVMRPDAMIFFSEYWVLNQLFHFPLSLSSRGSLVLFHFLPWGWCHLNIWGYWYFSWQSWCQLVLHLVQHFSWCTLHISLTSKVTIHSFDILLSQFGTSLLFHVQFKLLLLDLHTDFSGGRSDGLVFPSL